MMEVLVGPTYTVELEVSSSSSVAAAAASAYVRDSTVGGGAGPSVAQDSMKVVSSCLFLKEEEEAGSDDLSGSSSSSSIGATGDSDDDEGGEGEVSSSKLLSLDSLEDSLPIKRGLSSHFTGKSKSFANLSEVSTVKDLKKTENPFNKRRRVLIANKWSRKSSSFYSWQNPKSMPLLTTLHEDQDHHDDHDDRDRDRDHHPVAHLGGREEGEEENHNNLTSVVSGSRLTKKIGFKSQSCFSLADLHDDEENYQ